MSSEFTALIPGPLFDLLKKEDIEQLGRVGISLSRNVVYYSVPAVSCVSGNVTLILDKKSTAQLIQEEIQSKKYPVKGKKKGPKGPQTRQQWWNK